MPIGMLLGLYPKSIQKDRAITKLKWKSSMNNFQRSTKTKDQKAQNPITNSNNPTWASSSKNKNKSTMANANPANNQPNSPQLSNNKSLPLKNSFHLSRSFYLIRL